MLAPAAPYTPGADEEAVSVSPIRRAIAEHMVRSKHTSPHATTMGEVDITNIARWIERHKDDFKQREAKDKEGQRRAAEALEKAMKKLREQLK